MSLNPILVSQATLQDEGLQMGFEALAPRVSRQAQGLVKDWVCCRGFDN